MHIGKYGVFIEPYVRYQVTVAAATSVGIGPATAMTFYTFEGGYYER